MAYSSIDNPSVHFDTKLYTGNGSNGRIITGIGFQPDWVWIKNRSSANPNKLFDSLRGVNKSIKSNSADSEATNEENGYVSAFNSDGFTLTQGSSGMDDVNKNSDNYVSWNWLGAGTAPAITYTVKVVSDSGNKYRFDDFGTSAVTLDLQEGGTYTFDQSDSSNSGHPLRFSTTSNGTHGGGSEYTTGVTTNGTPGNSGAYTRITVAASAPTLYYYCSSHSAMGGQANTNSLFGSSNFKGDLQAVVSANVSAGFSVIKATSDNSSNRFIGHGLNSVPDAIWAKNLDQGYNWDVYYKVLGYNDSLKLNATDAGRTGAWGSSAFTTTKFQTGNSYSSANGNEYIYYCFHSVKGYSSIGSYVGNGSSSGPFIYTGFQPAMVIIKRTSSSDRWVISDNKRDIDNPVVGELNPNDAAAEDTSSTPFDFVSNGFKIRRTGNVFNGSGSSYIYMAFASSPFVNSNGVPTNAR